MNPNSHYVQPEQIANNANMLLFCVMFGGGVSFGIGYLIARRSKLIEPLKIYIWSGIIGVLITLLLMWLLHENGPPLAFCSLVGLFFGIRYGGEKNLRRKKRRERRRKRSS